MKKRVKILTAVILAAALLLSAWFAIVRRPKNDGYRFVIGMSQANLNEPWRIAMNEEIEQEAEKFPDVRVVFRDAGGSTDKQAEDIREFSESGINLLIVSMDDSKKLTDVVSRVYRTTPVIVLDRAVEGYDYTLYIGNDNLSIGRQAGELLEKLSGGKKYNVVEIQGTLDSETTLERTQGFHETLKKYPNLNLSRTLICNWKLDDTADDVKQILDEGGEQVDAYFAESDYMAQGVYQETHARGQSPVIVGVDGLKGKNGGLSLIQSGAFKGTFLCSTGGKEAVDYAVKILNGEQNIPKKIMLRSDCITAANVGEYLSASVSEAPAAKKITLGYAQVPESKWRSACGQSIQSAAREAGIDLTFLQSGTTQQDEKKLIRELIRRKVDILSFSPIVESGWDDVLLEAKRAGIPVIICDRNVDSDESLWKCSIGSDFKEEARRIGRLILQYSEETRQGASLKVLEICGTKGSSSELGRDAGLREILDGAGIPVTQSNFCDFTYQTGKEEMTRCLKKYGKTFQVVYAQNDDMALGVIDAIKAAGLKPGRDIAVFGTDGTRDALLAVKRGELYSTVECNPILGPQLVLEAQKVVNGERVPLRIINAENIFSRNMSILDILKRMY